jgi:hypothetical protein
MKSISEEDVQKAVDWLRDNAQECAKARATRIYLDEYRKSLKALLMSKYPDLPISGQERQAYAHDDYINHLKLLKDAIYEDERLRFFRASAEVKIEAWRTQQANIRSIKI